MDTAALQTLYGYLNFTTATVVVTGKEAEDDSITVSLESRSRRTRVCIETRTTAQEHSATLTRDTFTRAKCPNVAVFVLWTFYISILKAKLYYFRVYILYINILEVCL